MSISGDPLDTVRSIEDDFAEAMSRMYGVGNELARLRARLATEASPAQWTPTTAPTSASAARQAASSAPSEAAAQPAPSTPPPGLVTPPPVASAPAAVRPATFPPATPPPATFSPATTGSAPPFAGQEGASLPPMGPARAALPPTIPWWQRDGLVAKVLAVVGTAITLIGVAFLLALAIQMGYFGALARVISGGLLAAGLVGAAVLVRRRPSGTVGALGLAATGIATAYLDVLAVTRIYEWAPIGVGMGLAGLIALGGVLLARAWDSQLLAIVAVLGVALMSPFVGLDHGLLTGAFLLVLTAATWPAQIGRRWHLLELARIVPTACFLTVLAAVHSQVGIAALLGVLLAILVLGTSLAGARVAQLPPQLGVLVPVSVMPAVIAAFAVDDRWTGAALFMAVTCVLVLVAGLSDRTADLPAHLRLSELALATAGVTSLLTALRASDETGWAPVVSLAACLVWATAALVLRHRTTLFVSFALTGLAVLGSFSLMPHVLLRSLSDEVGVRHLLAGALLVSLLLVTARAITQLVPAIAPITPRILVALSVLWGGATVVFLGILIGQLADDPRGGFTAGQAGATVLWMATAAALLMRGLRGSSFVVPAGLALAAFSVGKLLLFDLAFLGGIPRVLSFIVAGLLLLGMGAGYAQALERTRKSPPQPPTAPVDNSAGPGPLPPTV